MLTQGDKPATFVLRMKKPPFSRLLQNELRKHKLSIRAFGKMTDPDDPERGRRRLQRHLAGTTPTPEYRALYARLLDAPQLAPEEDDDAVAC